VSLKIPTQIRLVGKIQPVCYLLNTEIGRLEEYLYFKCRKIINHFFGRMTCQQTTDARQVLSRNTEFACIENDIPLRTAIFVHQSNELMKKFVRTTAALNLFMGEKAVYFVVYIKQETLQVIARYLVAETMIGIGINSLKKYEITVNTQVVLLPGAVISLDEKSDDFRVSFFASHIEMFREACIRFEPSFLLFGRHRMQASTAGNCRIGIQSNNPCAYRPDAIEYVLGNNTRTPRHRNLSASERYTDTGVCQRRRTGKTGTVVVHHRPSALRSCPADSIGKRGSSQSLTGYSATDI